MRTVSLFGAAILAASCVMAAKESAAADSRPLSGPELQALLLGNTLIGIDEDGPFWMYYPSADTIWGRSAGGDVDVGRWWIEDGSYCRAWRRWFDGSSRCWRMAWDGGDQLLWYSPSGAPAGSSIVREGNAIGDVPQGAADTRLADASTGLSAALNALVAHAIIGEERRTGTGGPESAARGEVQQARAEPFGPGAPASPGQPAPSFVPELSVPEAPAPATQAGARAEDRSLGVAEASAAAPESEPEAAAAPKGGLLDSLGSKGGEQAGAATPDRETGGRGAGDSDTGGSDRG
jgi:hypothetical protein